MFCLFLYRDVIRKEEGLSICDTRRDTVKITKNRTKTAFYDPNPQFICQFLTLIHQKYSVD